MGALVGGASAQQSLDCGFDAPSDTLSLEDMLMAGIGGSSTARLATYGSAEVDTIKVRLIHVTFPETSFGPPTPGLPSAMDVDRSTSFPAQLEIVINDLSPNYVADVQNVLRLDAPDSLWVMDEPVLYYQSVDSTLSTYGHLWAGRSDEPPSYASDSEFLYEVIDKVGSAYASDPSSPPYPYRDGETILMIVVNEDTDTGGVGPPRRPWGDPRVGGWSSGAVRGLNFGGLPGTAVFDDLGIPRPDAAPTSDPAQSLLRHCRVVWQDNWPNVANVANLTFHEIGHALGFAHPVDSNRLDGSVGAPAEDAYEEDSYPFAGYDQMRAVAVQTTATTNLGPLSMNPLRLIRHPLRSPRGTNGGTVQSSVISFRDFDVEYLQTSRRGLKIYDAKTEVGSVYVVPVDSVLESTLTVPGIGTGESHRVEGFVLSYHSGLAEDAKYPSDGVAIWRYINTAVNVYYEPGVGDDYHNPLSSRFSELEDGFGVSARVLLDLESGWGRWTTPSDAGGTPSRSGATADAVAGYDNHDWWPGRTLNDHSEYLGSSEDFFTSSGPSEFSYRTNPSSFGTGIDASRRAPRDEPQSLFIEVLSTGTDATGPYAIVDVLHAPYESITAPVANATLEVGVATAVTWGEERTFDSDGTTLVIDKVDIVLHRTESSTPDTLVTGHANTTRSYSWTPTLAQASVAARIEVIYQNTLTSKTEADTTDGTFRIGSLEFTLTDRSADVGLNIGWSPYEMFLFDADADGDRDLLASHVGGAGQFRENIQGANPDGAELPQYQTNALVFATGEEPEDTRSGSVGDYDGDGLLDLFLAGDSGPRLYRNTTTTGPSFEDAFETVPFGTMATASTSSWTGTWFDYDRDGDLDLYVGRGLANGSGEPIGNGLSDALFANDGDGTFTDVTSGTGIGTATSGVVTTAVSWADYDLDGEFDVFVGQGRTQQSSRSLLLRQTVGTGLGAFAEVTSILPGIDTDYWNSALSGRWEDLNGDGILDLAVAARKTGVDGSAIFWNSGDGTFSGQATLAGQVELNNQSIGDIDLDGDLDIAAIPDGSGKTPVLWQNDGATSPTFTNVASDVGITSAIMAEVRTIQLADLAYPQPASGGDGTVELLVGRPETGVGYFYETRVLPSRMWVGVELSSNNFQNPDGVGATIRVDVPSAASPTLTVARPYGGASGAVPSDAGVMYFGLGDTPSGAEITVTWPDGSTTSEALTPAQMNQVRVIEDDHLPGEVGSVGLVVVAVPPSSADWVFTWVTDHACDPAEDAVTVQRLSKTDKFGVPICTGFGPTTLEAGDPDVTVDIKREQGGKYRHTLTWEGPACQAPCSVQVTTTSGTAEGNESSTMTTITIPACAN